MRDDQKGNSLSEELRRAGSKGGKARSAGMSSERRKEVARQAADARWADHRSDVPRAVFGSPDTPLRIGVLEIPCYVLDDNRRVIVMRGMLMALDMSQGTAARGGGDRLVKFVNTKGISPFVSDQLHNVISKPIRFRAGGVSAHGYEATVLADMCEAVLEARKEGNLHYQQEHIAERCEMLIRAFAKLGVVALVDEATGYQEVRDRTALQAILDKYLRDELAAWAKRFPDEFYKQIFRLRGWAWQGMAVNRPQVVAHYTTDIVYERLTDGILEELEKRNPKTQKGSRPARHHQWLTEDVGHPALAQHLYAVIGLMRISPDWETFVDFLDRAFPKRNQMIKLPMNLLPSEPS